MSRVRPTLLLAIALSALLGVAAVPALAQSRHHRPGRHAGHRRHAPRPKPAAATAKAPVATPPAPAAPAPPPAPSAPAPVQTPTPTPTLARVIADVRGAEAVRYAARDSAGHVLGALKVRDAGMAGQHAYLGVSHSEVGSRLVLHLASSNDLMSWHFLVDLDWDASQGDLVPLGDGSWLVAYEKGPDALGHSHVRLRHYADLPALASGRFDRQFDAPLAPSVGNEGTPNVYVAALTPNLDHSRIVLGLHYLTPSGVDRQQVGVAVDFRRWQAVPEPRVDAAITGQGFVGNVGDRDAIRFVGSDYVLIEAQRAPGDWGTWRPWLYDPATGAATRLDLQTAGGSVSFGNPTATLLTLPDGRPGILCTAFVFSAGSAPGEAGEVLYARHL